MTTAVRDIRRREVLERQSLNMWLKVCPKCIRGDVARERDRFGWYLRCWQCGWYYDATQRGTPGFWELEYYIRQMFTVNAVSSTGNYALKFSGS